MSWLPNRVDSARAVIRLDPKLAGIKGLIRDDSKQQVCDRTISSYNGGLQVCSSLRCSGWPGLGKPPGAERFHSGAQPFPVIVHFKYHTHEWIDMDDLQQSNLLRLC